jgi:hypothetical protein
MLSSEAAERFALPASGRAGKMPESRKNSKPEKCLKNAQNPTCRVHALLGAFEFYKFKVKRCLQLLTKRLLRMWLNK